MSAGLAEVCPQVELFGNEAEEAGGPRVGPGVANLPIVHLLHPKGTVSA